MKHLKGQLSAETGQTYSTEMEDDILALPLPGAGPTYPDRHRRKARKRAPPPGAGGCGR
jgi:hypothetical protein